MGENEEVGLFHPGTQHSWQTARALKESDLLKWYATSIFYKDDEFPYFLLKYIPEPLKSRLDRELRRFYYAGLDPKVVRTFGIYEWIERVAARCGYRNLAQKLNARGNIKFSRRVTRLSKTERCSTLWGYDTSSVDVFRNANGERLILDKTIGDPLFYNKLMESIRDEFSIYFPSWHVPFPRDKIDIIQEEYELSDVILCGSQFCLNTVAACNTADIVKKARILEYSFDPGIFPVSSNERVYPVDKPVNFLFLGQAGPRKGIHLILEAFKKIPRSAANLTVVGDIQIPAEVFAAHQDRVNWVPTVPRREVARYMADADCLLFPSYFEGAGIILYEAMAQNMGIIQSKNAAIVLPEDSKLLLSELSVSALYDAVMNVVEDRELLYHEPSHRNKILSEHTYEAYRDRVSQLFN